MGVVGSEGGRYWDGAASGDGERETRNNRAPGGARLWGRVGGSRGRAWWGCRPGVTVAGGAAGPLARVGAGRRRAGQPLAGRGAVEAEAAAAGVVRQGEMLQVPGRNPAPRPRAARGGGCRRERGQGSRERLRRLPALSRADLPEGCASYRGTAGSTLRAPAPALDRAAAGSGGRGTARCRSATGRPRQARLAVGGRGDPRSF